jgi:hypothetical protein
MKTEPVVLFASNRYLAFEGIPGDARRFVEIMRELADENGIEYPKIFGDFLFSIEVSLAAYEREGDEE